MTVQELKQSINMDKLQTSDLIQVRLYFESLDILVKAHGKNVKQHPHAIYLKGKLIETYKNQIV